MSSLARALRRLQEHAQRVVLRLPAGDRSGRLAVALMADASFSRQPRGGSQQGYVLMLGDRRVIFSEKFPANCGFWQSTRIKRVVRSTLAAEAATMATGYDMAIWLRTLASRLLCASAGAAWAPEIGRALQIAWSDCRSLAEMLAKDTPAATEKRVLVDIFDVASTKTTRSGWRPATSWPTS